MMINVFEYLMYFVFHVYFYCILVMIEYLMYFVFHVYFYCISVMINDNKRVWISHVFCVPRVFLLYFRND